MININIKCNNSIVEKSLNESDGSHDQPLSSKESVVVKEKDMMFTLPSDGVKLDEQDTRLSVVPHATLPAIFTSSSPTAVRNATPKMEPPSLSVVPATSTGIYIVRFKLVSDVIISTDS